MTFLTLHGSDPAGLHLSSLKSSASTCQKRTIENQLSNTRHQRGFSSADPKVSPCPLCVRKSSLSHSCHVPDILPVCVNWSLGVWNQTKCLIKKWNEYSFISRFFHLNSKEAGVGGWQDDKLKSKKPSHLWRYATSSCVPCQRSCVSL